MPWRVPALACACIAALAFGAWQSWRVLGGEAANGHLPADFPYAYLDPADDGRGDRVVVWRGRVAPATIVVDGRTRWPAAICRNASCPVSGGMVFAQGYDPAAIPPPHSICPACSTAFARASAAERGRFDPTRIEPFHTPEAERIIADLRADLAR